MLSHLSRALFLVLLAIPALASTVNTVTCRTGYGQPLQTISATGPGTLNCSAGPLNSGAKSSVGYGVNGDTLSVTASDQGIAWGNCVPEPDCGISGAGNLATASMQSSLGLLTDGPTRPGYVTITADAASFGGGTAYSFSSWNLVGVWSGNGLIGYTHHTFSVQLGNFALDTLLTGNADNGPYGDAPDFLGSVQVQLQFFEADGITPVPVTIAADAPEPSSAALLALAFLVCAAARRWSPSAGQRHEKYHAF